MALSSLQNTHLSSYQSLWPVKIVVWACNMQMCQMFFAFGFVFVLHFEGQEHKYKEKRKSESYEPHLLWPHRSTNSGLQFSSEFGKSDY